MQTIANDSRTADEARQWLAYHGMSVAQWARAHGFSRELVYQVLAGQKKGVRGQSHDIAVRLGMKAGALRHELMDATPQGEKGIRHAKRRGQ